jgi:hypothetical protein
VRVRVAEEPDGGMGSVGLPDKLHLEEALAQIAEVASLVRAKLDPVMPSKATIEFGVSFSAASGKLTSLIFEGKGETSLTVTLEWERPPERPSPGVTGT